jgi:hypothetical protein
VARNLLILKSKRKKTTMLLEKEETVLLLMQLREKKSNLNLLSDRLSRRAFSLVSLTRRSRSST